MPKKPTKEELEFLRKTAEIESSGGKNVKHPAISSGIHAGTSAIGRYGLMPKSMAELRDRLNREGKALHLKDKTPQELAKMAAEDPDLEEQFALQMLRLIRSRGVDDATANYMWQYGHNRVPSADKVQESPRTKKFMSLEEAAKEMLQKQTSPAAAPQPKQESLFEKLLKPVSKSNEFFQNVVEESEPYKEYAEAYTKQGLNPEQAKQIVNKQLDKYGSAGQVAASTKLLGELTPKLGPAAASVTAAEAEDIAQLLKSYKAPESVSKSLAELPETAQGAFADEFVQEALTPTAKIKELATKSVDADVVKLAPPKSDSLEDLGEYYSNVIKARKKAGQSVSDIPASAEEIARKKLD